VVPSRQSLRSRDTVDATRRVFVTAGSSLGVPAAGLFDVDWNENADFIEVSQGELGRGETTLSSALGIGECKLIVLLENALVPAKEPFADSHLSLRFSLPRCKRIVVQGKRGIEVTTQLTELVRSTHLDLRLGESMVGSLFNVDTSCVEIESQIGLRNADLGKLPSEKHTIDLYSLFRLASGDCTHLNLRRRPAVHSGRRTGPRAGCTPNLSGNPGAGHVAPGESSFPDAKTNDKCQLSKACCDGVLQKHT
jgi:hypothetical protein